MYLKNVRYDGNRTLIGFKDKATNKDYFYLKNLQGDIMQIISSTGDVIVEYTYDPWGKVLNITGSFASTLGNENPFRYRSYYYDDESGFYYLNSRYYDPEICRFISADDTRMLTANLGTTAEKNLFAYCANNPVAYEDETGLALDTVFDVVSFGLSIAEVIANPTDVTAWAGLVGDAVDLIPFVTGVGETVKGLRFVDKLGNTLEISKAVDFTDDARKAISSLDKSKGITKSTKEAGIAIHKGYKKGHPFSKSYKEAAYKTKGIRLDYHEKGINKIYELKPQNSKSMISGVRQLQRYNNLLGGNNIMRLEFY